MRLTHGGFEADSVNLSMYDGTVPLLWGWPTFSTMCVRRHAAALFPPRAQTDSLNEPINTTTGLEDREDGTGGEELDPDLASKYRR